MAAIFNAWATRLAVRFVAPDNSLPSEILVPGHKPSHEAKCLALLERARSGPTSAMTFNAVVVSMPSMAVRSTPQMRKR